jgi:aminoglycoside 6'-N-acetyltransferase I
MSFRIRAATPTDARAIADLMFALWPIGSPAEHQGECEAMLAGEPLSTMPLVLFVAEDATGAAIGFVEVGLRSHADGCDPKQPVGFIEGWYVSPEQQGGGVGRALMQTAEAWARDQGCTELASDTWLDNTGSQLAHQALGFEVVDRCVNFRKPLR